MKKVFLLITLVITHLSLHAQTGPASLYHPAANAQADIAAAIKSAKAQHKQVLIQAGGNWCSWCIEFNRFCTNDRQIDSLLHQDYITYHLNYSPENKNLPLLAKYGYPQRFGFPVFLVLDENGNRLHTQHSAYLEQGKSYNKNKVREFLTQWNRKALDPSVYKNF